jgi:hypothetical protein
MIAGHIHRTSIISIENVINGCIRSDGGGFSADRPGYASKILANGLREFCDDTWDDADDVEGLSRRGRKNL